MADIPAARPVPGASVTTPNTATRRSCPGRRVCSCWRGRGAPRDLPRRRSAGPGTNWTSVAGSEQHQIELLKRHEWRQPQATRPSSPRRRSARSGRLESQPPRLAPRRSCVSLRGGVERLIRHGVCSADGVAGRLDRACRARRDRRRSDRSAPAPVRWPGSRWPRATPSVLPGSAGRGCCTRRRSSLRSAR